MMIMRIIKVGGGGRVWLRIVLRVGECGLIRRAEGRGLDGGDCGGGGGSEQNRKQFRLYSFP